MIRLNSLILEEKIGLIGIKDIDQNYHDMIVILKTDTKC